MTSQPRDSDTTTNRRRHRLELAPLVVLVIATVVVGVVVFRGGGSDGGDAQRAATPASASSSTPRVLAYIGTGPLGDHARRAEGDPLALGRADAPVVMIEYADYRCPFCAKFSRDLAPQLVKKYVDAGQLRIEWRDLPIYGDQSMAAARAARAAGAQGKFWEFNHALYAHAPANGHPAMPRDKLLSTAREAGVPDLKAFAAQLDSTEFDAAIAADNAEGQALGIPATPAFAINGHPLLGTQTLDKFTEVIDSLLEDHEAGR